MSNQVPPALSELIFSAKIDYLSLSNVNRRPTSRTSGRVIWPPSKHGKQFTVHDPSAADIAALALLFPEGQIAELEISVDIGPKHSPGDQEHLDALKRIKSEYVAKGLLPRFTKGTNGGFRGAYQPGKDGGYSLRPFNLRVPGAREQLLYGHRNDGVQVKVYIKGRDNRRALPIMDHRVRVEVRLGPDGLQHHGLERLCNLEGFKFRTQLRPYFQHVHDTRPRQSHWSQAEVKSLLTMMDEYIARRDKPYWASVGVGAFLRGGSRQRERIHFFRHLAMNDRIGQALHRLQSNFSAHKFVCSHSMSAGKSSFKSSTTAKAVKSSMTYSILPGSGTPNHECSTTGDTELDELLTNLGS